MPKVWERTGEDLRKTAGIRYHGFFADATTDLSADKGAAVRILDLLTKVDGIQYIPEGARAVIYRNAAKKLRIAKNASYGWANEEKAARTLEQFGPWVPKIAFEKVYQEILSVYCGNYWGRSDAHEILQPYIDRLSTKQIRQVAQMFQDNDRVRSELGQKNPKKAALSLLQTLRSKLTIVSHIDEIEEAIASVEAA